MFEVGDIAIMGGRAASLEQTAVLARIGDRPSASNPGLIVLPRLAAAAVDDLATRLAAVEAELDRLRDIVGRLTASRVPNDDATFLGAIAAAVGDHLFSARELLNHATVDTTLRAAIGGASAKQIGRRLRRVAGQRVGPYRVLWVDRDNDGNSWRLQVFPEGHL